MPLTTTKFQYFEACPTRNPNYVVLNIFLKQQQQKCPESLKASLFNYNFGQFNDVSDVSKVGEK